MGPPPGSPLGGAVCLLPLPTPAADLQARCLLFPPLMLAPSQAVPTHLAGAGRQQGVHLAPMRLGSPGPPNLLRPDPVGEAELGKGRIPGLLVCGGAPAPSPAQMGPHRASTATARLPLGWGAPSLGLGAGASRVAFPLTCCLTLGNLPLGSQSQYYLQNREHGLRLPELVSSVVEDIHLSVTSIPMD